MMKLKIINTLKLTFFDAIKSTTNILATIFGGVLAGVILFYNSGTKDYTAVYITIASYAVVFCVIFNIKAIVNISQTLYDNNKNNPYALAIRKLSAAFSIIHEIQRQNNYELNYFVSRLESFCTIIKETYQDITGSNCSVSIKIHVDEDQEILNRTEIDPRVITFCRDT